MVAFFMQKVHLLPMKMSVWPKKKRRREHLHNPREDAVVRIGIGHKAVFAAHSRAIGKKSNAVGCPGPQMHVAR
jgi:hypothetical protein